MPADPSSDAVTGWPGERFGAPASGAGSVAGWGLRLIQLAVDWVASQLIVAAVLDEPVWWEPLLVLTVLWVQTTLLTGLLGTTLGHRITGLAVVRVDGTPRPLGLGRAALRALLLCLAIPPLIWDQDRRGLHDLAGGAVVVRR